MTDNAVNIKITPTIFTKDLSRRAKRFSKKAKKFFDFFLMKILLGHNLVDLFFP